MTCRLLIECSQPLVTWKLQKLSEIKGLAERRSDDQAASAVEDDTAKAFVRNVQESCMVKATIDIEDLPRVRDLLHSLKVTKIRERKLLQEKHKQGIDKHLRAPSKIREGLPEWVNYIPAKWYSSTIRQVLEYLLMMYTLLTLMWAIWQLYKHVHFIRRFLRPVLDLVEFYLDILRYWFRWLDEFADIVTNYWWLYMKPVYLLAAPLYAALAQLFKPLRNIAGVISTVTQPVVATFRFVVTAIQPLFRPAIAFFQVLYQAFQKLIASCALAWNVVAQTTVVRLVVERLQGMGLGRFFNELSNGSLDPLKLQVVMIRDLLIRSLKQIYYGLLFIFKRIDYMRVFVRRERDYANEETTTKKDD